MKPHPLDFSFTFPSLQGHFSCICSRCLNKITSEEIALRMLRPDRLMAFEEYRYCEACQRQAGFTPQRSTDEVWARLAMPMREHPAFVLPGRRSRIWSGQRGLLELA